MNAYANHMVSYLFAQSWQIALLAGLVGLMSRALRNRSAHLRYLLWLIVLAKCLIPPVLTVPVAVLPERPAIPFGGVADLPDDRLTPEPSPGVESSPAPRASTPAMPTPREWVALAWMAGVLVFLLWVGGRAVRYCAWLRNRRTPLPPDLQKSLQALSLGFQFRKWPRIWLLEDISQPFVWGLLRGSIYLPADFVRRSGSLRSGTGILPVENHAQQGEEGPMDPHTQCLPLGSAVHRQDADATTNQQRSVLAHELSHIARFDAGVNLLQVLAQAAYWFHPFVWWANRKIRQEREKCCDEMAVAQLGTAPERYTGAIVDALAAERRSAHPIPSLAIVGSVRDIEERIKTMLKPGKVFRARPSIVAATVTLLIALVTIPTALVLTARGQGQPPAQKADNPATGDGKPEQSGYAARTFNSKAVFDVFVRLMGEGGRKWIGRTPNATPLEIPVCYDWGVRPPTLVTDWDLLIREINEKKVPTLILRSATDSDVYHLAALTGLECLELPEAQVTDAAIEYLKGLTKLRYLELSSPQITGASFEHLKGLTELDELSLDGTQLTDAGLQHLKALTTLTILHLSGTRITDAGLQHLRGMARLNYLRMANTQITGAGLEYLKDLQKLDSLELEGSARFTGVGLEHLKGLTGLWLNNTGVTDEGLEHFKGLTKLQVLYLRDTPIGGAGLEHLKNLTELWLLDLSQTQVTDAGLENLKGLTGLTSLYLRDTPTIDAGLHHLSGLNKLGTLDLSSTQVTGAGLEHLKAFTNLRDLRLSSTQTTDAGLVHLRGLTGLKSLTLAVTKVTGTGLEHLKGLSALQFLSLDATQITDTGLTHLKGLTALQTLSVKGTKITDAGLEHLKNLTGLQVLYLGRTAIMDGGLAHLQGLSGLRELWLDNTQITDTGLEHLKTLIELQTLAVIGTRVTDTGVQGLKQSLPRLRIIRNDQER